MKWSLLNLDYLTELLNMYIANPFFYDFYLVECESLGLG